MTIFHKFEGLANCEHNVGNVVNYVHGQNEHLNFECGHQYSGNFYIVITVTKLKALS